MEYTLDDLEHQVRFRGDYKNVRQFPTVDVKREIQLAFGSFYQIVADTHQGWWDTQAEFPCVAQQAFIAPPKALGVWRVQGLDILEGTEWREVTQVPTSYRNTFTNTYDQPTGYRTSARGLELYPPPNSAYQLRLLYTPKAPELKDSEPREWFNGWEDYVIEKALWALDKRERKPLGDREKALAEAEAVLRSGAGQRRQQEPEYLNLREGGSSFDRWRDPV